MPLPNTGERAREGGELEQPPPPTQTVSQGKLFCGVPMSASKRAVPTKKERHKAVRQYERTARSRPTYDIQPKSSSTKQRPKTAKLTLAVQACPQLYTVHNNNKNSNKTKQPQQQQRRTECAPNHRRCPSQSRGSSETKTTEWLSSLPRRNAVGPSSLQLHRGAFLSTPVQLNGESNPKRSIGPGKAGHSRVGSPKVG